MAKSFLFFFRQALGQLKIPRFGFIIAPRFDCTTFLLNLSDVEESGVQVSLLHDIVLDFL